jgi:hypothetical protein
MSSRFGRVLLLVGSLALTGAASAHPSPGETIAAARRAELGTTVTVTGSVTVPTGAFDTGLALQQGEAGIYVLDSLGGSFAIGTEVEVTGVLVDSSGLLALQPSSLQALGRGKRIEPECRATGAVGERTEGRLLRLQGTMQGPLVDDSPYGFKLDIDDGSGPVQVFLYPGTGISTDGLVNGAELSVVCFSNQFETVYECDPRSPADLQLRYRR